MSVALVAALLGCLLVGLVRHYALRRALLDLPTHRSSHRIPTPRGGGLGLVTTVVLIGVARLPPSPGLALAALATLLVAWIGWLDDRGGVPVRRRLAVHALAGLLVLPLALHPDPVPEWLGPAAAAWWLVWTVSAINVTNFMDGIDGLIGLQVAIFGGWCWLAGAPDGAAREFGAVLAGAAAGFLAWNWERARIFLGDVGSGALGVLFVVGGLLLLREGRLGLVGAYLPLYPLFLDATVTLVRRARRGERLTEAHRSHLYQRLANEAGWGHARVALAFGVAAALGAVAALAPAGKSGHAAVAGYLLLVPLAGWRIDRSAHP